MHAEPHFRTPWLTRWFSITRLKRKDFPEATHLQDAEAQRGYGYYNRSRGGFPQMSHQTHRARATGLDEVEAFLAGEVYVPDEVDVKSIRSKLEMTQSRFSDTFGFSLDAIKHWEGGRRTPEAHARTLLTVIDKNPAAVIAALHPELCRKPLPQTLPNLISTARSPISISRPRNP